MIGERGIGLVSLYVALGGEQRRELEIGDYGAFFERLRASDEGATTSQPSIGDFVDVYGPLLEAGRPIVSVHLAAGISGTYESALQARRRLIDEGRGGERIHVIDSRTGCGGLGMLVLAACAAAAGATAEAVVERVGAAREELRMWFAIDTLEYLRKGGRIGSARAWLGSALQIKPILTLEDEIAPVERVRTRRRVFERLVQYAEELHADGRDAWVVQHIRDPENAQRLVERCREVMGSDPVFVSEIGPVIGTHTGPGLLGIGGMPAKYLEQAGRA
ncbi:MAG: DegV family protein [Acidobacteria bacterium]|nr:MAG: DegV family protein [Acidobacteriota bacterium]